MTAETGELIAEYYTNDRAKRIWIPELKMDLDDIKWFLESRCFDRNRPDKQILLERLNLGKYRPSDIVRETHGMMMGDYFWLRFPEDIENGTTYEDIKPEHWR